MNTCHPHPKFTPISARTALLVGQGVFMGRPAMSPQQSREDRAAQRLACQSPPPVAV